MMDAEGGVVGKEYNGGAKSKRMQQLPQGGEGSDDW